MLERNMITTFLRPRVPHWSECWSLIDEWLCESGWKPISKDGTLFKKRGSTWRIAVNSKSIVAYRPERAKHKRPLVEVARSIARRVAKERGQILETTVEPEKEAVDVG